MIHFSLKHHWDTTDTPQTHTNCAAFEVWNFGTSLFTVTSGNGTNSSCSKGENENVLGTDYCAPFLSSKTKTKEHCNVTIFIFHILSEGLRRPLTFPPTTARQQVVHEDLGDLNVKLTVIYCWPGQPWWSLISGSLCLCWDKSHNLSRLSNFFCSCKCLASF